MSENKVEQIIKEVNATMSMENQTLKEDEKISLRRNIIKNLENLKKGFKERNAEIHNKMAESHSHMDAK